MGHPARRGRRGAGEKIHRPLDLEGHKAWKGATQVCPFSWAPGQGQSLRNEGPGEHPKDPVAGARPLRTWAAGVRSGQSGLCLARISSWAGEDAELITHTAPGPGSSQSLARLALASVF